MVSRSDAEVGGAWLVNGSVARSKFRVAVRDKKVYEIGVEAAFERRWTMASNNGDWWRSSAD